MEKKKRETAMPSVSGQVLEAGEIFRESENAQSVQGKYA